MTLFEWLRQHDVDPDGVLFVNLVTAGYRPCDKSRLLGVVVSGMEGDPVLVLESGATDEQVGGNTQYTGLNWTDYTEAAVPAARAQRLLLDVVQSRPRSMVVSYSVSNFLQPWLLNTAWAQYLLQYPMLDFVDFSKAMDQGVLPKYLAAASLPEFSEWIHGGTTRGYKVESVLQRFGAVSRSGVKACLDRNFQLRDAFRTAAGAVLC